MTRRRCFCSKGAWVCGDCLKDALYDMSEFEVAELLDLDTETAYSLGRGMSTKGAINYGKRYEYHGRDLLVRGKTRDD